jgi:hypothetical protein
MEKRTIGNNVEAHVGDDNMLVITIDMSRDLGPSSTGKTRLIATTSGNVKLPGGERIGLNVYRTAASPEQPAIGRSGVELPIRPS